MVLVIIVLCAVVMFLVQEFIYRNFWYRNLESKIEFQSDPVYEGEEATLIQTVTNAKILPLPALHVKYQTDRKIQYKNHENTNVSDKTYKHDVFSMMPYRQITRTLPIMCTGRGYFDIKELTLTTSNIFMTSRFVEQYRISTHLYVYPRRIRTDRIEIPFRSLMGNIITRRVTNEDPFEFRGIRDYRPTDPMKSINWKASSKTDRLLVNLYDYTAGQEVRILLNLEDDSSRREYDLLEESIRLAASLAERLIAAGVPVSLLTNGVDTLDPKTFSPEDSVKNVEAGSGGRHMQTLNEVLARIDLEREVFPMVQLIRKEIESSSSRKDQITYVLISYVQRPTINEAFLGLTQQVHAGSIWLLPVTPNMEIHVTDQRNAFDVYKWEVGKNDKK